MIICRSLVRPDDHLQEAGLVFFRLARPLVIHSLNPPVELGMPLLTNFSHKMLQFSVWNVLTPLIEPHMVICVFDFPG